jgi:medium-chain acyl-[acyl-carrier-protein] hydrolase
MNTETFMASHDTSATWQETYLVRSYEADVQGNATMPLLCRLMQESASNHAEHLGLGITWLNENNLAWVLRRQRITMDAYPRWGETVRILTWPTGKDRLLWHRDFSLLNEKGDVIGRATTAWLVIDRASRRPQRADTLPPLDPPSDVERAFPRWAERVAALSEHAPSYFVGVRYRDLDVNAHVNSAQYIEWTLEAFDLGFHRTHHLREIEVNYLLEALYKDRLSAHCERAGQEQKGQQTYLHSLVRDSDKLELYRARTLWEPTR